MFPSPIAVSMELFYVIFARSATGATPGLFHIGAHSIPGMYQFSAEAMLDLILGVRDARPRFLTECIVRRDNLVHRPRATIFAFFLSSATIS